MHSYMFVNGVEVYNFKAKDSEINAASLCLGNVSKILNYTDMSMIFQSIMIVLMLDIYKYLMKKHNLK